MNKLHTKSVFAGIVIFFSLLLVACSEKKEINLYRIYDGKSFGFIDSTGKVIIPPKFRYASDFQEGFVTVSDSIDLLNGSYVFINEKGDTVLRPSFKLSIDPIDLQSFRRMRGLPLNQWFSFMLNEYSFSNGLALVYDSKTQLYGYINNKGDIAIEPKFVNASKFKNGYAIVRTFFDSLNWENTRTGIINSTGKFVIEDKYYNISRLSKYCVGTFAIKNNNSYSLSSVLLNSKGKVVNTINSGVAFFGDFSGAFAPGVDGFWASLNGTRGFFMIDSTGNIFKDPNGSESLYFDDLIINRGKYFWYRQNGKYGWFTLDQNQNIIITDNKLYDTVIQGFNREGVACVKWKQSQYDLSEFGYIDTLGEFLLTPKYYKASDFKGPIAQAALKKGALVIEGYINKKGEFVWSREIRDTR